MFIRCFLEIKFADMRLISLEQFTYNELMQCNQWQLMTCITALPGCVVVP